MSLKALLYLCLTFEKVTNFLVSKLKASLKNIRASSTFTKNIREWGGIECDLMDLGLPLTSPSKGRLLKTSLENSEFQFQGGSHLPLSKPSQLWCYWLVKLDNSLFLEAIWIVSLVSTHSMPLSPPCSTATTKNALKCMEHNCLVEMHYFSVSCWDLRRYSLPISDNKYHRVWKCVGFSALWSIKSPQE